MALFSIAIFMRIPANSTSSFMAVKIEDIAKNTCVSKSIHLCYIKIQQKNSPLKTVSVLTKARFAYKSYFFCTLGRFKIQRQKETTGRVVFWNMGITCSYTLEASYGGTNMGSRAFTHFNTDDYEGIGRYKSVFLLCIYYYDCSLFPGIFVRLYLTFMTLVLSKNN